MLQQAHARVVAETRPREPQSGGNVVPLFRGQQVPERPLVTLGNGLWKKPDVARVLSVSERTVERWMKDEGLPADKPWGPGKGPVRFDPRKVEAWWNARCANGGAA